MSLMYNNEPLSEIKSIGNMSLMYNNEPLSEIKSIGNMSLMYNNQIPRKYEFDV